MKKKFLSLILILLMIPCTFMFSACGGNPSGGNLGGGDNGNDGGDGGGNDPNWPTYSNVSYEVSNVRGGVVLEDVNFTREGEFPSEFHVPKYVNGKKVVRIACEAFSDVYQDYYLGHNWDSFNDPVHNFPYNKVIIPDTVEVVDSGAFCLSTVKEVEFQGANTQFGNFLGGAVNSVFTSCFLLEKVRLPANLTLIHHQMFQYCMSLKDIVIPETVTKIEWLAFDHCEALETITIPASVQEIEREAFTNGYKLETVYLEGNTTIYDDYDPVTTRGASFKNCGVNREFEIIYI